MTKAQEEKILVEATQEIITACTLHKVSFHTLPEDMMNLLISVFISGAKVGIQNYEKLVLEKIHAKGGE